MWRASPLARSASGPLATHTGGAARATYFRRPARHSKFVIRHFLDRPRVRVLFLEGAPVTGGRWSRPTETMRSIGRSPTERSQRGGDPDEGRVRERIAHVASETVDEVKQEAVRFAGDHDDVPALAQAGASSRPSPAEGTGWKRQLRRGWRRIKGLPAKNKLARNTSRRLHDCAWHNTADPVEL